MAGDPGHRADTAADPGAVGVHVAVTVDNAVVRRVVGVDLPTEEARVERPQLVGVGPHDLEVDDGLSHDVVSFAPGEPAPVRRGVH
jgi:hypothetical protein